jgi:hypothetical protein
MRHSIADAAIGAPDDGGQHYVYDGVEVFRGADLRVDVERSKEVDYKSRHPRVKGVLKNSTVTP